MRKLIVNADDFGFNREITDGILTCHRSGCVTSTTLMANMPAAEYAIQQSQGLEELSVGIHLNITLGSPVTSPEVLPDLVDSKGFFCDVRIIRKRGYYRQLSGEQLTKEFSAQIQKCLDFGLQPTHLDSHHNITVFPQINAVLLRLAQKFKIYRLRSYNGWYRLDKNSNRWILYPTLIWKNTRRMAVLFYYQYLQWQARKQGFRLPDYKYGFHTVLSNDLLKFDCTSWEIVLKNLPEGITEFVTHPGFLSQDLLDAPEYRNRRVRELTLFSDPKTKNLCQKHNIVLISYRDL